MITTLRHDFALISRRLRERRRAARLSQAAVADRCGVTQGALSLIETGQRTVSLPLLTCLAVALQVDLATLLAGTAFAPALGTGQDARQPQRSRASRRRGHRATVAAPPAGVLIGQRLRARRLAAQLTQAQLAARCGLTQGVLSLIENGRRQADQLLLARLSTALGIDLADLLADTAGPVAGPGLRGAIPTTSRGP